MTVSYSHRGSFKNTEKFLKAMKQQDMFAQLESLAREGVAALREATPVDEGVTAAAWAYEINKTRRGVTITWTNTNVVNGAPIAILLQYGHGTGTGGWVQGRDYINPAIRPIFDQIADQVWKAVTSA